MQAAHHLRGALPSSSSRSAGELADGVEGKQLTPVAAGFPAHRRSLDRPARSRVLAARSRDGCPRCPSGDSELDGDIAAGALVDGHLDDDVPVIVGQPLERLLHLPRPVDVLRRGPRRTPSPSRSSELLGRAARARARSAATLRAIAKSHVRGYLCGRVVAVASSPGPQERCPARPPRRGRDRAAPERRSGRCRRRRHRRPPSRPGRTPAGTAAPSADGSLGRRSARFRSPPSFSRPDQRLVRSRAGGGSRPERGRPGVEPRPASGGGYR